MHPIKSTENFTARILSTMKKTNKCEEMTEKFTQRPFPKMPDLKKVLSFMLFGVWYKICELY